MCTTVLTADRSTDDMLDSHMHADNLCRKRVPTEMLSSGSIHVQSQKFLISAVHQVSSSSSSNTMSTGTHGTDTSKLAGKLHAMHADAMDRAWQKQQESQRLAPGAAPSSLVRNSAAAAAAADSKLCQERHPSESAAVAVSAQVVGHSNVARQHPAASSQQALIHSKRPAINAGTAAVRPADPSLAPSAQPTADYCATGKPAFALTTTAAIQINNRPGSHGADLSTDTESLVAKLQALSQGRNDNAQSKASSKASRQQDQRYPFASRATNSNQPKPIAGLKGGPGSKQAGTCTTDAAATTPHAAAALAAADPGQPKPRPNTARCIQLLEPVHSGTEYGSATSPKRRRHSVHSHAHAASPDASNRIPSRYASVAAPIQLAAPSAQPPTAALPAPTTSAAVAAAPAAAAASSTHHEQVPASPVQHRLGRPTPMKKGFTPKPTRFRLEAEGLSLTPPDKPSSLEKVLFRSPVKAAAAPSKVNQGCSEDAIAGCNAAAAPEALPLVMREAEQRQGASGVVPDVSDLCSQHMAEAVGSQAMVTPANSCAQLMQADPPALPQGVFAHMKVILDPELSPQEGQRYSPLLPACVCSCNHCW